MGNTNLHEARRAANDEFYTPIEAVEAELAHYRPHFKGKSVFLNADDPRESAFFEYFALNFHALGLRKLVAIGYEGSPIVGEQLPLFDMAGMKDQAARGMSGRQAHVVEITHVPDLTGKGAIDLRDVDELLRGDYATVSPLSGDGDFRSPESIKYLKEADVVVTNPPFSLFREYVAQLVEHDKKFLILGNMNAVTYREVFPLIKEGKLWLGMKTGDFSFRVPDYYEPRATRFWIDETGQKWRSLGNISWFTNLDNPRRNAPLPLFRRYADNPDAYPTYDNYDAIEVSRVKDIPVDYEGVMGVPITFLGKHNPNQFQIIRFRHGNDGKDLTVAGSTPYFRILIRRVSGV